MTTPQPSVWKKAGDGDSCYRLASALAKRIEANGNMQFFALRELYLSAIRSSLARPTSDAEIIASISDSISADKSLDRTKFELLLSQPKLHQRPSESTWQFLLPANFNVLRKSSRFRTVIDNTVFTLTSHKDDHQQYQSFLNRHPPDIGYHLHLRETKRPSQQIKWPGYFSFSTTGANAFHAYAKASQSLWTLRGMLELVINGNTITYSFPAKAVRAIDCEDWAVGFSKDPSACTAIPMHWITSTFGDGLSQSRKKPVAINGRIISSLIRLRKSTHYSTRGSIAEIVCKTLELLASACDQVWDAEHFLHLWQIAEIICAADDSGGNTDVVARRIARFFVVDGLQERDASLVVKKLAQSRNKWVHSGDTEEINDRVNNEFRLGCCRAIWWLAHFGRHANRQEELKIYYSLATSPETVISYYSNVISLVRQIRSNA